VILRVSRRGINVFENGVNIVIHYLGLRSKNDLYFSLEYYSKDQIRENGVFVEGSTCNGEGVYFH
jgi:hypothetical protein